MATFSPEAQYVTKIIPQGAAFLRETADYVETLERLVCLYASPDAMTDDDAALVGKLALWRNTQR